jgi:hypothetical protein
MFISTVDKVFGSFYDLVEKVKNKTADWRKGSKCRYMNFTAAIVTPFSTFIRKQ